MYSIYNSFVLVPLAAYLIWRFVLRPSPNPTLRLPPGPKKLPIIGNLLDMPPEREWLTFTKWKEQYGNLVSLTVPGNIIIVVNSAKAAMEMLDSNKSRIYSDRPGWPGTNTAVANFNNMTEMEVHRFLQLLIDKPEDFDHHISRMEGSLILRITFGYETIRGPDPFLENSREVLADAGVAGSPGAFYVNVIPQLRYVPEWLPGAGFKRTAREWGKKLTEMAEDPYTFAAGTAPPSVVSDLLKSKSELSADDIHDIKWVAQSFYSGGVDTSVSGINAFFKAMVLYPEVQARAQAEIEAVIGNDRLPTPEDRENLPYVSALAMETLRWHVIASGTGVPREVTEDDIQDGYLIPKGSVIMFNVWAMTRDIEVYRDPETYDPTRFLKTEDKEPEMDPRSIVFGFGRRICPGRLLADLSIFTTCAMVLATFNITAHMEHGRPVLPDVEQTPGIVSHPSPFKCQIVPRSSKAIALIKRSYSYS